MIVARACGVLLLIGAAAPACAQAPEPIGRFVFDVRGAYARHKTEPSVATDLGVEPGNVPPRSYGIVGGGQLYFKRIGNITFGAGGEMLFDKGSRTLPGATPDAPKSPTVQRHFMSIAPEFSFNFGHSNGWSYISGGMYGVSHLYTDRADKPPSGVPWRRTLNYGAGARWFATPHIAFSVDARWYSAAPEPATDTLVLQPRTTLLLLSGGIAIK